MICQLMGKLETLIYFLSFSPNLQFWKDPQDNNSYPFSNLVLNSNQI
jgi:hypothetical protein